MQSLFNFRQKKFDRQGFSLVEMVIMISVATFSILIICFYKVLSSPTFFLKYPSQETPQSF